MPAHGTAVCRPATRKRRFVEQLGEIALRCWDVFQLRGYARVDFRVDASGQPWVLEINANPCISPDAGFAAALAERGIPYSAAIRRIIAEARRTRRHLMPTRAFRDHLTDADPDQIEALVRATGFFSPEEISIARELADDALANGDGSHYRFVLADKDGSLAAYACFGRIPGTRSAWDLYWIVVAPALQSQGLGGQILSQVEARVASAGGDRLYAETSSREQYAPTRRFYTGCDFHQAAEFPDFYAPGDGKIVYVKLACDCLKKEKPPSRKRRGLCVRCLAVTYSHMGKPHTTIGAGRFHFRVRNGIGWFPPAIAARQTLNLTHAPKPGHAQQTECV